MCCPWTSSRWARRPTTVMTACSCICGWKAPWTRVRRPAWPPLPPRGCRSSQSVSGQSGSWAASSCAGGIATALGGALIGIDAFDQPNVQESKDNTKRLLAGYTQSGTLPDPPEEVTVAADAPGLPAALDALLAQARPGDYVCLQAYVAPAAAVWAEIGRARLALRRRARLATTAGYGPRFLHSTGQYHKGGPNAGLFVQLVGGGERDAPIPGQLYSFGTLKRAQAEGDLASLRSHGRRVLRVELGPDPLAGLRRREHALAGAAGPGRSSGDTAAERAEEQRKGI